MVPKLNSQGLLIAFDQPVQAETLTTDTFRVLFRSPTGTPQGELRVFCECPLPSAVSGIKTDEVASCGTTLSAVQGTETNTGPTRFARFKL